MSKPLPRDFYFRDAVTVARDLLGKRLVRRTDEAVLSGWIVETEAYLGRDDPASHAYRGPTPRNKTMFGSGGHLYVYRSYGIHNCANVVTGVVDHAGAVLLRSLQPKDGLDLMRRHRGIDNDRLLTTGPGRLCEALAITTADDGVDLAGEEIFIVDDGCAPDIVATPRIGISVAQDQPWRFLVPDSRFLSRPYPSRPLNSRSWAPRIE